MTLDEAWDEVLAAGYVIVTAKAHAKAKERLAVAKARLLYAEQDAEHSREWARDCLAEERRRVERVVHLYGLARAKGATDDELRGRS